MGGSRHTHRRCNLLMEESPSRHETGFESSPTPTNDPGPP